MNKTYTTIFVDIENQDWKTAYEHLHNITQCYDKNPLATFLQTLEKPVLINLLKGLKTTHLSVGQQITEPDGVLYLLTSGCVKVKCNTNSETFMSSPLPFISTLENAVNKLLNPNTYDDNIRSGNFIGEMSLINPQYGGFCVEAIEYAKFIKIEKGLIDAISAQSPIFMDSVSATVADAINGLVSKMNSLSNSRKTAIKHLLSTLITDNTKNNDNYSNKGAILFKEGKFADAALVYRSAGDTQKDNGAYSKALALYKTALYVTKEDSAAKSAYDELLSSHPAGQAVDCPVNFIGNRLFLALLTPDKIMTLMDNNKVQNYNKDEPLLIEGEIPQHMFLIKKGKAVAFASMFGAANPFIELKQGDLIGDISLFNETASHFTVKALDTLSVYKLEKPFIETFIANSPEVLFFLDELYSFILEKIELKLKTIKNLLSNCLS
ncbi:MAG: cyclic nucleotide-binding domain-containing protein [Candidatus Magnetoovum sp. WYHC-5]|nr:cyclic nucleotide-binding domain-containing protein [Candidatus Magnetoovum sp. WYHC-5]